MNNLRPETTLFLLQSLDGKISSGSTDDRDFDKDFPNVGGEVSAGLQQYYDIEQTTELWSLMSGRIASKLGCNNAPLPQKIIVSFGMIDNTHLNERGCRYWATRSKKLVLLTHNPNHPMFKVKDEYDNVEIVLLKKGEKLDIGFKHLYSSGCKKLTVQTGGTINAELIKLKLIDHVDMVVAPIIIGNNQCMSTVDGKGDLPYDMAKLKLKRCAVLKNSYLRLTYDINY